MPATYCTYWLRRSLFFCCAKTNRRIQRTREAHISVYCVLCVLSSRLYRPSLLLVGWCARAISNDNDKMALFDRQLFMYLTLNMFTVPLVFRFFLLLSVERASERVSDWVSESRLKPDRHIITIIILMCEPLMLPIDRIGHFGPCVSAYSIPFWVRARRLCDYRAQSRIHCITFRFLLQLQMGVCASLYDLTHAHTHLNHINYVSFSPFAQFESRRIHSIVFYFIDVRFQLNCNNSKHKSQPKPFRACCCRHALEHQKIKKKRKNKPESDHNFQQQMRSLNANIFHSLVAMRLYPCAIYKEIDLIERRKWYETKCFAERINDWSA